MRITEAIRYAIGCWLLSKALAILPRSSGEWRATARGLLEQRRYDRYAAYCKLFGQQPKQMAAWRDQMAWIDRKFASRRVEETEGSAVLLAGGAL